ncbi:HSP20-like chaperone [Trametes versicolor FP-101664 SS1]|uniref:HSP20-like chaperone n=1 Tax=Trametes versicolor (strain FP-101664) TaxID=717944 RepID=UPI0004624097|nr:HSP20-like chaperone [Trametes versicolor FP-101664 SS1]EIW59489.1 HSP20-like chaperone [Trametes versicolor FP-101664 SS1]
MSLARQFFREMRPLFRMLEEPLGRPPAYMSGFPGPRALFDDPFFHSPASLRPAVDVSEQGNNYIVEAELPGVKKENVNVRIGDGGRTLTIEGKVFSRSGEPEQQPADASSSSAAGTSGVTEGASEGTQALTTKGPESNALSTERVFSGTSTFTRTVVLPRPVDSSKVTAKLSDGVLTVTVPKAEDVGSVQVNVK